MNNLLFYTCVYKKIPKKYLGHLFGTARGNAIGRINSWLKSARDLYGHSQAKLLITLFRCKTQKLLSLENSTLKVLTKLITGHCVLSYNQLVLGNVWECTFGLPYDRVVQSEVARQVLNIKSGYFWYINKHYYWLHKKYGPIVVI